MHSPPPPPKKFKEKVLDFSQDDRNTNLGEIGNNGYAKFWGGGGKQGAFWGM